MRTSSERGAYNFIATYVEERVPILLPYPVNFQFNPKNSSVPIYRPVRKLKPALKMSSKLTVNNLLFGKAFSTVKSSNEIILS